MNIESQNSGTSPLHGRVEIARVGVWSIAKISAVIYAIVGFIPGIFVALGLLVALSTSGAFPVGKGAIFVVLIGLGAIVVVPLLYGALGFVFGAIYAWVYNFAALKIGGVVIETRQL